MVVLWTDAREDYVVAVREHPKSLLKSYVALLWYMSFKCGFHVLGKWCVKGMIAAKQHVTARVRF